MSDDWEELDPDSVVMRRWSLHFDARTERATGDPGIRYAGGPGYGNSGSGFGFFLERLPDTLGFHVVQPRAPRTGWRSAVVVDSVAYVRER